MARVKRSGGFVNDAYPYNIEGPPSEHVSSDINGAISDDLSSRLNFPPILYLPDIAQILGRSEKAVRAAISRGRLPPLRRIGGRSCWVRQDLVDLEAETRGGKRRAVNINVSPYNYKNSARMLVTFTIPADKSKGLPRLRHKRVAPEGLDKAGAFAWAETLKREVWSELLGGETRKERVAAEEIIAAPAPAPWTVKKTQGTVQTLKEFWKRFETEYLSQQKPATRKNYSTAWCRYIRPVLGDLPLDAIDREALGKLRAKLGKMKPQSRNELLGKLRAALRQAEDWALLEEAPKIKMEKAPRRAEPVVYTEEEAERLIEAAKQEGGDAPVLVLLLLHGGLRSSEARALRWGDIDPRKGIMKIQHNYSDGEEATPKGGIAAPVGMSPELSAALRALPRGNKDDHVLTRVVREGPLKGQVSHHTPNTITYRLNKLQEAAGLEKSGPHRLRHACLTILAGRGTDPYRLQAHARHSRLSTTQKYIHLAREQAALEAAAMWGDPVPQSCPKKPQKAENAASLAN